MKTHDIHGKGLTRRRFLQRMLGGAAALPAGLALGGLPRLAEAAPAGARDYRALVCLYLHGGNDSFNMVVPRSGPGYRRYAASRGNLAVARDSLLPIEPATAQADDYGLHPALAPLLDHFERGDLAVVANVGMLPRPMTAEEARRYPAELPPQLFSHSDQAAQWQTGLPWHSNGLGWGGRMMDLLQPLNQDFDLPPAITLADESLFLVGEDVVQYNLSPWGPEGLEVLGEGEDDPVAAAFLALLRRPRRNLLERQFVRVQRRAVDIYERISSLLDDQEDLATEFPDSDLGEQLAMVARVIAARGRLDQPAGRQLFFVAAGGWDTHDAQNQDQPVLYGDLAACMSAFQQAMDEIGARDAVTLFTASEFGRTLTSNGDGTDHGWGGHHLVLGGAVAGGEIHGEMPELTIGGPLDVDGGRLVPTIAQAQYSATLAGWFGLDEDQLLALFPHLERFERIDLGFMNA